MPPTTPAVTPPSPSTVPDPQPAVERDDVGQTLGMEPKTPPQYEGFRRLTIQQRLVPWDGAWGYVLLLRRVLFWIFLAMVIYRFWPQIWSFILKLAYWIINTYFPQPPA